MPSRESHKGEILLIDVDSIIEGKNKLSADENHHRDIEVTPRGFPSETKFRILLNSI